MTIRYDRPVSRSAFWARRLAVFAFTLFVVSCLSHRFGPLSTPSLIALMMVSACLAGLAMLLALIGLAALWKHGAKGGKAASAAVFLAAVPLFPPALALPVFLSSPSIHDVTTDIADPPPFLSDPAVDQGWLPAQAPVTSHDREAQLLAYPEISGRRYDGALDRVLAAVRKVAEAERLSITAEKGAPQPLADVVFPAERPNGEDAVADAPDIIPVPSPRPQMDLDELLAEFPGDVILQGEFRTLVMGFPADVAIRLREETETTLVDVRVASRYGTHDLGQGSRFIQAYLTALDAELLGIAGD